MDVVTTRANVSDDPGPLVSIIFNHCRVSHSPYSHWTLETLSDTSGTGGSVAGNTVLPNTEFLSGPSLTGLVSQIPIHAEFRADPSLDLPH